MGSGLGLCLALPDKSFKVVGSSAIGGASLIGLCYGLTGIDDFKQILNGAKNGDASKINLTLGEITDSN